MTRRNVVPASLTVLFLACGALASPQVGDKAPAVKVAKWMTQTPSVLPGASGADSKVFVVEFWATWCGPCRKSIPHLADLHRKHQKDGLLVLGISNEEADVVDGFLKKKTAGASIDMPYFVGVDDDMATNSKWMEGIDGIPHAFIVNKTGQVVWTGHPLDPSFDDAVEKTLAGKFDVESAKKAAEMDKKYNEIMAQLRPAYDAREPEKILKLLDQLIVLKPAEVQPYLIKRQVYSEFKMEDKIPSLESQMDKAFNDSPRSLMDIVQVEMEKELADRNPRRLLASARRAAELSKTADAQALVARVQVELGMLDAAIASMKKAVAQSSGEEKVRHEKTLKYLEEAKKLAAEPATKG